MANRTITQLLPVDAVLFGISPHAREVRRLIHQVSLTDLPVLLQGESGTGKERVARWIHSLSPFAAGPFVRLSGTAISAAEQIEQYGPSDAVEISCAGNADWSVLEAAHDGTLYLDEIEELSQAAQAQLTCVLQEGKLLQDRSGETRSLRSRVISSIRLPFGQSDRPTDFRPEFFYSINAATFRIPSLRERSDEIPSLAGHVLREKSVEFEIEQRSLSSAALRALVQYAWPGNLREFGDILTSYALTGDEDMLQRKLVPAAEGLSRAA